MIKLNMENVKDNVASLLGKNVTVRCNRGRNKIYNYNGVLSEVYGNVFVVKIYDELFDRLSCTYTEVVCGEIQLKEKI